MNFTIPDEYLRESGLTERQIILEIACRLFAVQILEKHDAARLCGLSRVEFEDELYKRGLPVIIYTLEMWEQDLKTLEHLDAIERRDADQKEYP